MYSLARTARWTGVGYLSLAIFGMSGFLIVRPRVRVDRDPVATLANLVEYGWLAHLGVTFELLAVIAQAATAIGFYALFRRDRPVAAYSVATLGMANAISILASAALLVVASGVASNPGGAPADAAGAVGLLFGGADAFWSTGAVFFGLWLIPMGWFAISTLRMPRALGRLLVVGGLGYVLSALLGAAVPALPSAAIDLLTIPATAGELWMVGYLLIRGIRPSAPSPVPAQAIPVAG